MSRTYSAYLKSEHDFAIRSILNDLDLLVLAQHHGLPARLLDWTTRALVAAFFAVAEEPDTSRSSDMVIFHLRTKGVDYIPDAIKPFEVKETKFCIAEFCFSENRRTVGSLFYSSNAARPMGQFSYQTIPYSRSEQSVLQKEASLPRRKHSPHFPRSGRLGEDARLAIRKKNRNVACGLTRGAPVRPNPLRTSSNPPAHNK